MMPELGRNLLTRRQRTRCKWIGEMEPTPCQGEGAPTVGSQLGTPI